MSFIFNQMDFDEMFPTSEALRFEWEHLSGLSVESLEVPGMERRRFLETDRPRTKIEYTIILHSLTEQGAEDALDQFMIHIDPSNGPQRLIDKDYPKWYQMAAVSEEIIWERLTWDCATRGYRYRGKVVFETYGDASQRRVDEDSGISVSGGTQIQLEGNTRAWPRWEFSKPFGGQSTVRFTIESVLGKPSHVVEVQGPLSSGQKMVLDYDSMQFAVWQGDKKVASLVNRMSTLERPEIRPTLGEITVRAEVLADVTYEWAGTPHDSESIKRVGGIEVARNRVKGGSFEDAELAGWTSFKGTLSHINTYSGQMFDPSYGGEGPEGGRYGEYIAYCAANQADHSDFYMIQSFPSYMNISPGEWIGTSALIASDKGSLNDLVIQFRDSRGVTIKSVWDYREASFYKGRKVHKVVQAPPTSETVQLVIWARTADGENDIEGTRLWAEGVIAVVAETEEFALLHSADYWDGDTPGSYQTENATARFYPNSRRQ